jgi:hypothetical protein
MKQVKIISLLCYLLWSVTAFSQKLTLQDWVQTNSGDTLYGNIRVGEWNKNPNTIIFKGSIEKTYYISDLLSFGVVRENSLYRRFTIIKHLNPVNEYAEMPIDESKTDTATVWLKMLTTGKLPLTEFTNSERSYFYYIKDNRPVELIYSKGIKNFNDDKYRSDARYGRSIITENLEFKKQLFDLNVSEKELGDISEASNSAEYTAYNLSMIFNKLNKVSDAKSVKSDSHLFLGIGASVISTTVSGNGSILENSSSINSATSAIVKIGYQIKSSKPNTKFGFIPEIGVAFYNTSGSKPSSVSKGFKYSLKNTLLATGLSIRYTVNPQSAIRFELNGGVMALISISKSNQTSEESLGGTITVSQDTPKFKSVFASPSIGASLSFSKFNVFADYKFTSNLTEYINTNYKLTIISLGLAFNLL